LLLDSIRHKSLAYAKLEERIFNSPSDPRRGLFAMENLIGWFDRVPALARGTAKPSLFDDASSKPLESASVLGGIVTLGRADYQRQYEPFLYGWKEGSDHYWCGARDQGDIWFIDKPVRNDLHPTMKPVALDPHGSTTTANWPAWSRRTCAGMG
jgi:hypothetical protein